MRQAGFKLPKVFGFLPLNDLVEGKPLGVYVKEEDMICINADYPQFTDLRAQNELEEAQGTFHPTTKHFLQTYLHEFSHAAHFHNLCDRHGYEKAIQLFDGILNNCSPDEFIVGPLNAMIKSKCPKFGHKIIDSIFPPSNGLYALKNLKEYFAEKKRKQPCTATW